MAPDEATRNRPMSRGLLPLALLFLVLGVAVALVLPFLSLFLTTAVHADPVQATVFLIVAPLSGVAASTIVGRWSDRWPIRRAVLIGAATAGVVGAAMTAFVRDYWVLLGLTVTVTAAANALFPQTFAYARQVLDRTSPSRTAMGISAMRTVFSVAWVFGPPLGALLLHAGGFTALYGMAAAMYAIGVIVAVGWLKPLGTPAPAVATLDGDEPAELAPSRMRLLLTAVGFTALQCPLTLAGQALPLFVDNDLGGDVRDAGLIFGLCAALEIPLILGLGALTARVRLRTLLLAGAACGIAYYGLVAAATDLWQLAVGQVLNALFIAAVSGLGISYVQDMMPHRPGRATTMFTNTFPIGAILAGPLFGLAQQFGFRLAYAISAVLCTLGLAALLAARPRTRPVRDLPTPATSGAARSG